MTNRVSGSDRILAALRAAGREGVTNVQMMRDLYVLNATGRVSDLRKRGHDIRCERVGDSGTFRYWLVGAADRTDGVEGHAPKDHGRPQVQRESRPVYGKPVSSPAPSTRRPAKDQQELFHVEQTQYGTRIGGHS